MNLNVTYASSVPQAARTAIGRFETFFEASFTDAITLNYHVDFTGAGSSIINYSFDKQIFSYAAIHSAISRGVRTQDDNTALNSSTLPSFDPNPNPHSGYDISRSQQKALGLLSATDAGIDMNASFSSNITWDYDRSDGIASGSYDFMGWVAYTFSIGMGRVLSRGAGDIYTLFDAMIFSASSTHNWKGSASASYFSIDGGQNNLAGVRTNGYVGDFTQATVGSSDAFTATGFGALGLISVTDLRLLDLLGFDRQVDDVGGTTQFFGLVNVNSLQTGNHERVGDHDWFQTYLTAGQQYRISLNGSDTSEGTLTDPTVRLYNRSSNLLATSDDEGPYRNSVLYFTPTTSDYYYIDADAYSSNTGVYTLYVARDDFEAESASATLASLGTPVPGSIEAAGDHDWFGYDFKAGVTYAVSATALGALNPVVALYRNENSSALASDNDSGAGINARLIYSPATSGRYYADVGGFGGSTGDYKVNVFAVPEADFNGDGFGDLLWRRFDGQLNVWNSTGRTFTSKDYGIVSTSFRVQETADFDGDGMADILWRQDGGGLNVWTSTGSNFTGKDYGTVSTSFFVVGAGDVSGDGRADIVWQTTGGGLNVWTSTGTTFTGKDFGIVGPSWHVQAVADFGGDGKEDLLFRNDNGALNIWTSTGTDFTSKSFGAIGNEWFVQEAADFNFDGRDDILWRNANGAVNVWTSTGTDFVARDYGIVSTDWFIQSATDTGGDGRADIVWRNANGALTVWSATGDGFVARDFGVVDPGWQIVS